MKTPDEIQAEQRANCEELLKFFEEESVEGQCKMSHWAIRYDGKPIPVMEQRGKPDCGTAACLSGWAALKLAPTTDSMEQSPYVGGRTINSLLIPEAWLEERDLAHIGRWYNTGNRIIKIQVLGRHLLGQNLSRWFGEQDGPSACDMADREWIIAVLRKELGKEYDDRLDSYRPEWERREDGPND